MGRTACTGPQCLYMGALYLYLYHNLFKSLSVRDDLLPIVANLYSNVVACHVLVTSFLTHYFPLANFQTSEQSARYLVISYSNATNSIPADTIPLTSSSSSQLPTIPRRQISAMSDGVVRISRELRVCRRVCVADHYGTAPVRQASRSTQFCNQTYSNYTIYVASFEILVVLQLRSCGI